MGRVNVKFNDFNVCMETSREGITFSGDVKGNVRMCDEFGLTCSNVENYSTKAKAYQNSPYTYKAQEKDYFDFYDKAIMKNVNLSSMYITSGIAAKHALYPVLKTIEREKHGQIFEEIIELLFRADETDDELNYNI